MPKYTTQLDTLARQIFMAVIAYKLPREYADAVKTETRQVLQKAYDAGWRDAQANRDMHDAR